MTSNVQIEVLRTPDEVAEALKSQRIAACPVRSRIMWATACLCHAALMIKLPHWAVMKILPYAGIYAYGGGFQEWRRWWASYVPPDETISHAEREQFLGKIADILESS